jgi:hypothetical protein
LEVDVRNLEECLPDYLYHDRDEIPQAVGKARAMAPEGASGDLLLARLRYSSLVEQGAFFKALGRVNWRVVPRAPVLEKALLHELLRMGQILDKFLQGVERKLETSSFLRDFLGFPSSSEEELLLRAQKDEPLKMLRVDLVLEEGKVPKLVEIQVVMGGLGITQALRTAYGPHPLLPGIAKAYEEALEAIPKRDDLPKVVATLGARNSHYRHEHLCLARHLSTWRMIVAPLFLLEEGPSGVRLGDTGIGVIHRLFRAPGALKTEPGKRVLRAVLQGRVILINPWKDFFEDKRLLALVHEDRAEELLEDHLTEGEWKSLQEMIPPTWKATRERLAQVMGLSGSSRSYYLKKGRSWECKGLFHGRKLSSRQWEAACKRAKEEGDWILQKEVRSTPTPWVYWDPSSGAIKRMMGYTRMCPYYFRGRDGGLHLADVLLTVRETSSRVHGASDAILAVVGDDPETP